MLWSLIVKCRKANRVQSCWSCIQALASATCAVGQELAMYYVETASGSCANFQHMVANNINCKRRLLHASAVCGSSSKVLWRFEVCKRVLDWNLRLQAAWQTVVKHHVLSCSIPAFKATDVVKHAPVKQHSMLATPSACCSSRAQTGLYASLIEDTHKVLAKCAHDIWCLTCQTL